MLVSVCSFVCFFVWLSVRDSLSVWPFACLSICLSVCLSVIERLFAYVRFVVFVCASVCLFACLFIRFGVCVSDC